MIFPMGMGVGGAAAATSVSCCVGAVMVLIYFFRFADRLKFTRIRISAATFGSIVNMAKIGFATFLTEGAMGVMMFTGNYAFMKAQGESGVAAFSIACYLFPVVFSISNAVAQSAQPIISYNYGAGASGRVRSALRVALFTAIVCGLAVTAFISVCDRMIVSAFLPSCEKAFELAVHGLPLFSLCAVFFALNVTFIGYYQSIEDAGISTLYTLSRSIVFLVPAFLLLPDILGTDGLWLAIPSAEILTLVMIISVFIYKRKIKYNHQI